MNNKKRTKAVKVFSLILSAWLVVGAVTFPAMAADVSNQENSATDNNSVTTTASEGESSESTENSEESSAASSESTESSEESSAASSESTESSEESSATASEPTESSEESSATALEPTESGKKSSAITSEPTEDKNKTTAYAAIPSIIVGGVTVTDSNKDDILGDGTCSLAYNDESSKWELTLNGVNLTQAIKFNASGDYVIKLAGENTINYSSQPVSSNGNLTISGEGSLNITGDLNIWVSGGSLTIADNANVTCNGRSSAIFATDTISVINSSVTASTTSDSGSAVAAGKSFSISGGTVNVTAGGKSTNALSTDNYSDSDFVIKDGSNVTLTSDYATISSPTHITIDNSTVTATATADSALYAKGKITVSNSKVDAVGYYCGLQGQTGIDIVCSQITAKSSNDSAIFSPAKITISGEDTTINSDSYYCSIIGKGGIDIDGGDITCHSTNDHPIFTNGGDLSIQNAKINITSDFENATGLYMNYSEGNLLIENSNVNIDTGSTSVYSANGINIDNSQLEIKSGGNAINAKGDLLIEGKDTTVITNAAYPNAGKNITINNGDIHSETTEGSTFAATNAIKISGGKVYAKTAEKMSAIYAKDGDITIEGADTSVEAISEQDSAIFSRHGKINLLTDNITATGANGFAAIVARTSSENNTGEIVNNIILGDKLAANKDNIIGATVWQSASDGLSYYSDTAFVPVSTDLPLNDLSTAPNTVTINYQAANYDKVDEALKKVPADLTIYTDDSVAALNAAINAVDRNMDINQQETVNNYAVAIENAINALELKPVTPPTKAPTIISGANQTIEQGKEATFKSDADYKDFIKLLIDGKEVSSDNYTVESGSTIVTLKADYIKTLTVGKHTLSIVSANGQADTEFTVKAASTETPKPTIKPTETPKPVNPTITPKPTVSPSTTSPQTGDNFNSVLWICIFGASALAIAIVIVTLKRKIQTKH